METGSFGGVMWSPAGFLEAAAAARAAAAPRPAGSPAAPPACLHMETSTQACPQKSSSCDNTAGRGLSEDVRSSERQPHIADRQPPLCASRLLLRALRIVPRPRAPVRGGHTASTNAHARARMRAAQATQA